MTWLTRETRGEINQLKVKLANAKSGNLSMSRRPTGEYSIESSKINLLGERRKSEGKKRVKTERRERKKKRKGRGGEEDLKNKKREKRKNRKAKMNRCMWKRFIYIQA